MINEFYIIGDEVFIKLFSTKPYPVWTIIDLAYMDVVAKYRRWYEMIPQKSKYTSYAQAKMAQRSNKDVSMHRIIMRLKRGDIRKVDHKNRNGLDNRRDNLRIVNTSINSLNKNLQCNNESGVAGVIRRPDGYWQASITINNRFIYLGRSRNKNRMVELRQEVEDAYLP